MNKFYNLNNISNKIKIINNLYNKKILNILNNKYLIN